MSTHHIIVPDRCARFKRECWSGRALIAASVNTVFRPRPRHWQTLPLGMHFPSQTFVPALQAQRPFVHVEFVGHAVQLPQLLNAVPQASPASRTGQVRQHRPARHELPLAHVPQLIVELQPSLTVPHTAVPQAWARVSGVHGSQNTRWTLNHRPVWVNGHVPQFWMPTETRTRSLSVVTPSAGLTVPSVNPSGCIIP